jgi:hypothetical protein
MRVGIYTHYAHCDQAYLAVRLADFVRSQGAEFDIYSDAAPGKLGLAYDRAVAHRGIMNFSDWLKRQSVLVWTHVPYIEQLAYVKRFKIPTVIAPMWQEMEPPFKKCLRAADAVVVFSQEQRELFHAVFKLRNVAYIPFDTGLPVTRKETIVNDRAISLFLPWFDRNARCASSQLLSFLGYLVERMPEVRLTVGITSSRFGPAIAKYFTNLSKRTENRVWLARGVPFARRAPLYGQHDLTLWPGECDNYGLCGLYSLAAGTPVVSMATAPQTDFLIQDVNAALCKTRVDYDDNGVPHAVPNYEAFAAVIQDLVADTRYIDRLQKKSNYNLQPRRTAFELGWRGLLEIP